MIFSPKEWAEETLADDQRIMAAGQVETTEDKYNHEGQTFIVQTVKGPLRDQNGDTIGVLAIVCGIRPSRSGMRRN